MEDLTRQQALTLEGLGAVARQVASALAFVHKKKRVHNDVKPANILLHDAGGRGGSGGRALLAKLADFGLADLAEEAQPVRDYELFGLTIFSAATQEAFKKYDRAALEDYVARLAEKLGHADTPATASSPEACRGVEQLRRQLPATLRRIWKREIDMTQVADLRWLEELQRHAAVWNSSGGSCPQLPPELFH